MNINRNNNNRRRGRGNNRAPGGGNGPGNRIDSRARGNAPQLLEKYRKLAQDASMNDDRVQTEYYLQFADHYFRVLADSRSPKDEARGRRDFDREQGDDEDQEDEFEEVGQSRAGHSQTSQPQSNQSQPRQAQPSQAQPSQPQARHAEPGEGQERPSRERPPREQRTRNDEDAGSAEGQRGTEGEVEAAEEANPFVRDTRARRPRTRSRANAPVEQAESEGGDTRVDPAVLPPSIVRSEPEPAEEQPARPRATRTRTRRPRPADSGDAETLEAVN